MTEIINNILLTGDKFMSELHLKQTGLTYSACGKKQEFKNFEKQVI